MWGAIGAFFSGIAFKAVCFLADKALAGAINGTMDSAMKEKIGEYIDSKVDQLQNAAGTTGKAARQQIRDLMLVIAENLSEADGTN